MPFDNLEKDNLKKVNLFLMIVVTALAAAAAIFIPFLNFAGLALVPVPATVLLALNRKRDAVICAIAGLLFLFILNYVLAMVLLSATVALAFIYRHIRLEVKKPIYSLAVIFSIFVSMVLLFLLINSALMRQNFLKEMLTVYENYVNNLPQDDFLQTYSSIVFSGQSQYNEAISQTQAFLRFMPKILPGFLAVFFGLVSLFNYYFSYFMLKKTGASIESLPQLKEWDLHWYWCWGAIIGIVMVVIPDFNRAFDGIIDTVGYNLIIVFGFLYLVLGIAVLWGLLERFNIRNTVRYIILIIIFLTFGLIFLPALGLIDIWANFRKLKRSH